MYFKIDPVNAPRAWVFAAVAALALSGCNPTPPDQGDYLSRLTEARAAKDASFLRESEPVPANRKAVLLPLAYFPINPEYDVPGVLKPFAEMTVVDMPTSTGTFDKMRRVGSLEFVLKGTPLKLTAFAPAAAGNFNRLFVPFRDLTSGSETYQTGRYLDLERTSTGLYQIDFNRAYNPYCYFSPTWVCPIPPPENRLTVRVEAGEQVKGDHPPAVADGG